MDSEHIHYINVCALQLLVFFKRKPELFIHCDDATDG